MATTTRIRVYRTPVEGGTSIVLIDAEAVGDDFRTVFHTRGWPTGKYRIRCTAQRPGEAERDVTLAMGPPSATEVVHG